MNASAKCPHCGGEATVDYVAVSYGRIRCNDCGYKQAKGELRLVSNNENANLGELIAGLAVVAIGGLAIAALFDALNGGASVKKPKGELVLDDYPYLSRFR
jgi:hypothetical protein